LESPKSFQIQQFRALYTHARKKMQTIKHTRRQYMQNNLQVRADTNSTTCLL